MGDSGPALGLKFPLGAAVTLEELELDPHPLLARLRESEPVAWIPPLDGWLVTRHDLALGVTRDAATFTVEDPRFSTARVIGPSMLSLDGDEHARHRTPFVAPFRPGAVRERFADATAQEAERILDALRPAGAAELRRSFAGKLAASIVARALGLDRAEVPAVLGWHDAIVGAVTEITAGRGITRRGTEAFGQLSARLRAVIDAGDPSSLLVAAAAGSELDDDQLVSNAAVLLFGGIETTEGMIANAALHLLAHPDQLAPVRADPRRLDAAIEGSLRLEPAAAVIDRYATTDWPSAGRGSRPASWCGCRSPPPTGIRPCSSSLTGSTSAVPTRAGRSPLLTVRTCASASISPGWRRARRLRCCSIGCRGCALTRRGPQRCAGWCFASPHR